MGYYVISYVLFFSDHLIFLFCRSLEDNNLDGSVPSTIWNGITLTGNRSLILYEPFFFAEVFFRSNCIYVIKNIFLNNAGISKTILSRKFRIHLILPQMSPSCMFSYIYAMHSNFIPTWLHAMSCDHHCYFRQAIWKPCMWGY